MSPYWAKPQGCGLGQLLAQEGTMIVYVAFEFPYIKAKTKKAQSVIAEINSECDTMSVAFDASGSWVSSVIDGEDDVIED